jgi:hypothetical protein
MHAHDRTLLAALSFSDKDKKDSRHDAASRYLAKQENALRLAELCIVKTKGTSGEEGMLKWEGVNTRTGFGRVRPRYEVPIHKGEGKYRNTVGFMDLVLDVPVDIETRGVQQCKTWSYGEWEPEQPLLHNYVTQIDIRVEVKIGEVGVGDIIRQINLYKSFLAAKGARWVAATLFPLTAAEVEQLKEEDIFHIQLGEGFKKYHEETSGQESNSLLF